LEIQASRDAYDQDTRYGYRYYLTPTQTHTSELEEPSLAELARVIKAGSCIEASFKRGKSEAGMDAYQVRTWEGWHHHMALTLIAVWFLISETHRGQQLTPALTLPQVRYGWSHTCGLRIMGMPPREPPMWCESARSSALDPCFQYLLQPYWLSSEHTFAG
jgi:hypothetical protein